MGRKSAKRDKKAKSKAKSRLGEGPPVALSTSEGSHASSGGSDLLKSNDQEATSTESHACLPTPISFSIAPSRSALDELDPENLNNHSCPFESEISNDLLHASPSPVSPHRETLSNAVDNDGADQCANSRIIDDQAAAESITASGSQSAVIDVHDQVEHISAANTNTEAAFSLEANEPTQADKIAATDTAEQNCINCDQPIADRTFPEDHLPYLPDPYPIVWFGIDSARDYILNEPPTPIDNTAAELDIEPDSISSTPTSPTPSSGDEHQRGRPRTRGYKGGRSCLTSPSILKRGNRCANGDAGRRCATLANSLSCSPTTLGTGSETLAPASDNQASNTDQLLVLCVEDANRRGLVQFNAFAQLVGRVLWMLVLALRVLMECLREVWAR